MKILGMGNALVDMMIELPDDSLLDEFGLRKGSMQLVDKAFSNRLFERTGGLKRKEMSGGSAANTICGLASLGIDTAFIGKIGWDYLGEVFQKDLEHYHIRSLLQYSSNDTGSALALISPGGERTFATYLGAAVEMEPTDIVSGMFEGYTHFYVEGYLVQHHELIRRAMELAKEKGLEVIIDLASFNVVEDNREFLRFLVKEYADVVFANAEEASAYTGKKNSKEALAEIARDCWIAIVKTGASGSLVQNGKQVFQIPADTVKCIDTTGAGDLYAAGFLYGLLNKCKFTVCGALGSLLAGKIIGMIGARIPDATWVKLRKQVKQLMA